MVLNTDVKKINLQFKKNQLMRKFKKGLNTK